jgi:TolB-like protein/Flp pilus assembly protein TadD
LLKKFLSELYRRGIFQTATAYLISAWAIAKIAELAAGKFAASEWVMQGVLGVLFLGFPVVLTLSWFYDFKTLALSFDDGDGELEKPDASIAGLMGATRSVSPDEKSIAVLPFVNMSADPENEYFADGLAEELLNLLARIPELKVSARTSSFAFKGKNKDVRLIGQELHVAHVLEGSVRKSAAQVRITAQLIRAEDGYHIWSETYDRKIDDIFAVQDELAEAVVGILKINLLGEKPQCYETDPVAFALYLKGSQLLEQREDDNVDAAQEAFQQALVLDPNYPAPMLGMAAVYVLQMFTSKLSTAEGVPLARAMVDGALVVNENCPDANSASALLAGSFEGDWKTAQASADLALKVAPGDARVLRRVASVIAHSGDLQRSVKLAQQAVGVDPLNTAGLVSLGVALSRAERWQEARTAYREALKLSDKSAYVHSGLAIVALMEGNPELALADVAAEVDLLRRDTMTILAHHAMGKQELAEQELQQFIEQYRESGIYDIAMIYAHTGKVDEAFEWLEKAMAAGDTGINCMRFEPLLKNLREDGRWGAMLKKVGLSG